MSTVLSVNSISKSFLVGTPDEFQALKSVSLDIEHGDFITIVGGNGAGKSTFLNAIAGTFPIDSGSVVLDGKDVTGLSEEERALYISRVFQDPKMGTAPRMTIAENLALAEKRGEGRSFRFALNDDKRGRYKDHLASLGLGLENRLDAEIGLLSGGQRQSVSLLMATLKRPEILLLDEHTAALDPKTSDKILQLTERQVKENNLTALMITHNLQDALDYGNRMIMLHQGEIVEDFRGEAKASLTTADLYQMMEGYMEATL